MYRTFGCRGGDCDHYFRMQIVSHKRLVSSFLTKPALLEGRTILGLYTSSRLMFDAFPAGLFSHMHNQTDAGTRRMIELRRSQTIRECFPTNHYRIANVLHHVPGSAELYRQFFPIRLIDQTYLLHSHLFKRYHRPSQGANGVMVLNL